MQTRRGGMKKSALATIIMAIALAVSGCSPITKAGGPTPSTSQRDEIIGFGATLKAWTAHHSADTSGDFIPGCCYNRDPSLKNQSGNFRYTDVLVNNGIVTGYSLNLPANTSVSDAQIASLAELPKDAKVSFFYTNGGAATLEATSPTLKPRLTDPNTGNSNGSVDFVFCSVAKDGTFGYNSTNVNSIWVRLGQGMEAAKGATC